MREILLTFIGMGNYRKTSYNLPEENKAVDTYFAPVAIWKMLDDRVAKVNKVLALTTEGVMGERKVYKDFENCFDNNLEAFKADAEKHDLKPNLVESSIIPAEADHEHAVETYEKISEYFPADNEPPLVHVDITHALRFMPILVLSILRLLQAKGRLKLGRIYYGQFEKKPPKIVDLTTFMTMSDFALSVSMFESYGLMKPMGERMKALGTEQGEPALNEIGNALEAADIPFRLGLPVTAGLEFRGFKEQDEIIQQNSMVFKPIADEIHQIHELAKALSIDKKVPLLDRNELNREIRMIEELKDKDMPDRVIQVIREWMVNRVKLEINNNEPVKSWLGHSVREVAEAWLQNRGEKSTPNDVQRLYNKENIRELRNFLAHSGFSYGGEYPQNKKNRSSKETRDRKNKKISLSAIADKMLGELKELDRTGKGQWKPPVEFIQRIEREIKNRRKQLSKGASNE